MSKKQYVIQQDSPNLVIVPTVTCYEPSPEKKELENTSSSNKFPGNVQKACEKSALNNAGVKVKPRVSSVNNNVLIDVRNVKRQPNSWATNFLQSIGGSASKLPRAYNWQPSASKTFLRNDYIQPTTYMPIAHQEMHTNTTQSNVNKETTGITIKELASSKTGTNIFQPKLNAFSLTKKPTKTNIQYPQPKHDKEFHQSIESKNRFLPSVNKDSSHFKVTNEAKKEASQPKLAKDVTDVKSKNELSHLTSNTKNETQTKEIFNKRGHKEATKLRDKPETCQKKIRVTVSDTKIRKEKSKSKILKENEKKRLKKLKIAVNRENISQKKLKVDRKKSRESSSDKNKKSKEIDGKKIHRESSKSKKSISPIKSVVKKIKNYASDDSKHSNEYELNHNSHHLEKMSKESDVDLRARLKRKGSKNDIPTQEYDSNDKIKCKNIFPTMPKRKTFVPNENLIISFDTENDTEESVKKMTPVKTKARKSQSSGSKCKKIKLVINIVFQKDDTTDDESPKCGDMEEYENNTDLSFLDDFNVDEIVESLNDCQTNVVKIGNIINLQENKRTSKTDVDLPIPNERNSATNNYERLTKGERIIGNNSTNDASLTLCNGESIVIKTENKAIESIIKVESLTDTNSVTENNNDTCELKNIPETPIEAGSVKGGTDKLSNTVEVKTEFVANYATNTNKNICSECCKEISAINSNNMKNLSETATLQGGLQLKNENVLTRTEIKSEEVCQNPTPSTWLDTKNTEIDKTTNIEHEENFASYENETLSSDMKNERKTMNNTKPATSLTLNKVEIVEPPVVINNTVHVDEVILIEDSDNECDDKAEVQRAQNVAEHDIIDLTFQNDCSLDTTRKEMFTADTVKPNTNETDSEPILIIETDYDELKINDELNNENGVMESEKNPQPIDIIKKHLFGNSDNTHASDKILLLDQTGNSETKKSQCKNTETVTLQTNTRQDNSNDVKLINATAKNIRPSIVNKKDAANNKGTVTHNIIPVASKVAKAAQNQAQIKTQIQKELNVGEEIPPIKENHENIIKTQIVNGGDKTTHSTEKTNENNDLMWLEKKISLEMRKELRFRRQKNRKLNKKLKKAKSVSTKNSTSNHKENSDGHIRMWVVNKGDTSTHTVVQNQPIPNPEDTKDENPKNVNNKNTQNENVKGQTNKPKNTSAQATSIGNKNTPTPKPIVRGDPRIKENQSKRNPKNTKDDSPKILDNKNTQNVNVKDQTNEPKNTSAQAASIGNKNAPAPKPIVRGDPRIKENQPKPNPKDTKDAKPKILDNRNTQNVNVKDQTNEPKNTSAQATSIGNKNAAPPKPIVRGDPRIKENQSKRNPKNTKDDTPKILDNKNTQNVNVKDQTNEPKNTSTQPIVQDDPKIKRNQPKPNSQQTVDGKQKTASPQNKNKGKGSTLSRFGQKKLVEIDLFAQRLECRMRVYFAGKYCVTDLIHNGRFSTIYLVIDPDGVSKAVKRIKETWQLGAHKEGMMLKLQNGVPESNYNCVRYGHGFTVGGLWCYMMEYYPKNLQEALNINNRSYHIDKVQEFSRQLVAAVTILRNNNIIHSDINPSHILVNESETRIKLCGFDQAFYYNGGNLLPNVGTASYRAPELILGFHADYGIDVWATALVMYQMATNRQLFPGCFNNDILYKHLCTLEIFPYDMLEHCYYRDHYFMGNAFIRIVGSRGEGKVLIRDFYKKERIHSVFHQVYLVEWAKFGSNRVQDKGKLNAMAKLLNKMLVMDPRSRIAIEFVFADPFIFESFESFDRDDA